MTDSSSCARFNPARPLLELHMGSLSIGALPPLPGLVRALSRPRCIAEAQVVWRNRLTTTRSFHGKRMVCELGGH